MISNRHPRGRPSASSFRMAASCRTNSQTSPAMLIKGGPLCRPLSETGSEACLRHHLPTQSASLRSTSTKKACARRQMRLGPRS
eukprot:2965035-Heterocapsa_arctica.AAC.2